MHLKYNQFFKFDGTSLIICLPYFWIKIIEIIKLIKFLTNDISIGSTGWMPLFDIIFVNTYWKINRSENIFVYIIAFVLLFLLLSIC